MAEREDSNLVIVLLLNNLLILQNARIARTQQSQI